MKQHISVNRSDKGFFLMNNTCGADGRAKGMLPGTPYYKTLKEASIAMFNLSKEYTNIYDMSQKAYEELTSN